MDNRGNRVNLAGRSFSGSGRLLWPLPSIRGEGRKETPGGSTRGDDRSASAATGEDGQRSAERRQSNPKDETLKRGLRGGGVGGGACDGSRVEEPGSVVEKKWRRLPRRWAL